MSKYEEAVKILKINNEIIHKLKHNNYDLFMRYVANDEKVKKIFHTAIEKNQDKIRCFMCEILDEQIELARKEAESEIGVITTIGGKIRRRINDNI